MLLLRRLSVVLALFIFSLNAQAQSFEAELKRVAQLRRTFGDALVSALTNLPPNEYSAAREKALAMAEQVTSGSLASGDASATLCAAFSKGRGGCPEVSLALSAVDKTSLPEKEVAEVPVGESFSEAALSEGALENVESDGNEAELDSLELPDSATLEPELEPQPASAEVSIAKPRRASAEPELEAEEPNEVSGSGREVSSDTES